ncbi:unnamed protein product [Didymodactylos carnosus]|uniref:VCBS repeat-containing protein n=1 Tax=Didymodactylos carnosus TaxID=1234261 RepID=A0A814MLK8_9BILA|nr:unnamed protein product [Didymodactylos carnosus]CAF1080870.1 unnamed protein product [Didymodactylos carnosus]CAF3627116.1 unnamed protein product [Didymodactylos carnosus]CAF3846796.1 unnamed protein product [Didymodactylos carnosus]
MAVKTVDLNNDSFLDLVVANRAGNTTSVLFGYGNGSFTQRIDLSTGPNAGTYAIAIGDVNKDNQSDIVVVNRHASNIGVFLGHGNGTFSKQRTISTGINSTPAELALHDLNNDTFLDLVVSDHEYDRVFVFLGTGDGGFTRIHDLSTGNSSGPYLIIINDFNNDNLLDIAVGNGDVNNVGVFLGDGTGNFSQQITTYIESGPYALVAIDFNKDGILDIATANYDSNNTSILFGNGDGTFRLQNTFSTGNESLPYAVANGDFNRDNIEDLIIANSGTDNIGILLGDGNGRFRKQKIYSTGSGSNAVEITIGDFNRDNRLDFVSANLNNNIIGIFLSTCS